MIHVAIDARLPNSGQGGVLQVLRVLGLSFGDATVPTFQRTWIVYRGTSWWRETIPDGDEVVEVKPPFGGLALVVAQRFPRLVSLLYPLMRRLQNDRPVYDELLRSRGVDVVHLPYQDGFITDLPMVYNPHDLQHHYFPENFSKNQLHHRENVWRRRAETAQIVLAASFSVEEDLQRFWEVDPGRVRVVPIPPPVRSVPSTLSNVEPPPDDEYCIYPAVFWPHKNHLRLLEAVRILQDDGVRFPLVLTGAPGGIYREVRRAAALLPDPEQVRFTGHVTNDDLSWLIAHAKFMIVPSLFEAMSLTVWDGQRLGTPVACSSVDPFPDQVGDTAVTFDGLDPSSIARAMKLLLTDADLRTSLVGRSRLRVTELTNRNYALAMLGIYLEAAGRPIPEESHLSGERLRNIVRAS